MSNLEVRIVHLEPVRVASAHGFGPSPEAIAWDKILAFAETKGLLEGPNVRFFGFNNPNPATGSPNYGYEQWITVGPDVQPEGEVEVKDFAGGLYAVTRCQLTHITEVWHQLVQWGEKSQYRRGSHQWLEEAIAPPRTPFDEMVMDLYLPIVG